MAIDELLRSELVTMRRRDLEVRQQLLDSGQLGGSYVPAMEAVHREHAARLRERIAVRGWPTDEIAGKDGAEAAWFIVQHAIGEPDFARQSLAKMQACAAEGKIPAWHAAYLEDRIALFEGRPQRYGTQWIDDPEDGLARPWQLEDAGRVDEWRAGAGLDPLRPIPGPGPALPMEKQESFVPPICGGINGRSGPDGGNNETSDPCQAYTHEQAGGVLSIFCIKTISCKTTTKEARTSIPPATQRFRLPTLYAYFCWMTIRRIFFCGRPFCASMVT